MMAGRGPSPSGGSWQARQNQRAASDKRKLALFAALASKSSTNTPPTVASSRLVRDAQSIISAIDTIPMFRVGDSASVRPVSAEYRSMIVAVIGAMNSGERSAILCWPPHQACLPALTNLIALGDVASAPTHTHAAGPGRLDIVADPPIGFRAVLYPSARTGHGPAREIQLSRSQMATLHKKHVLRSIYPASEEPAALKDYHVVLGRVGAMSGRAKDGRSYAEFEHPVLDEIVPHGTPLAGCPENGRLLWRTKSKTDLGKFSRTGAADQPEEARFFLYEISADRMERELTAIECPPNLLLLDLSKTARGRLENNWLQKARKAVETFQARFPLAGVLAFTDDPWTCDAARFEILGTQRPNGSKKMTPSKVTAIYSPLGDILQDAGSETSEFVGGHQLLVDGFTGQLEAAIAGFRTIARKLEDRGNPTAAEAARSIVTKVRRCVCLPGSLAELSNFLERETFDDIASDNMAVYRISSELAVLNDPRSGATQISSNELASAQTAVRQLTEMSESSTPMASLLDQAIAPALRASSRTIVVFRNELIADFAKDRLTTKFDKLENRLNRDVIRLTTRQGLADLATLIPKFRNNFGRAIVVAPTRQGALEILSQPWLPEVVSILADSDTLRFAARDAARLAELLEHPDLKLRLQRFAKAATQRVEQIGAHVVAFDTTIQPTEDVEFPDGSVIDLAGPHKGDRHLIQLKMKSNQLILARPRTALVQLDDSHSVRRFVEVSASKVNVGDEICVIGPRFIEKARSVLNITAAAAEEIREYHDQVRRRFEALSPGNRAAKLKVLCEKMGAPPVATATASYWVSLEDEAAKPLHEVVPHAPRDRELFMRFTNALGIRPQMASRHWAWAVIAQRSSRVRAGAAFHDAYKGILTDEHAAFASKKERAAEIRALRAAADDYVSTVVEKTTIGGP